MSETGGMAIRKAPGSIVANATAGFRLDGPLARRHRARIVGDSGPLIVFSHGLGTGQSSWDGLLAAIAAPCRALLYDLPGAGPYLPDDFDPERYRSVAAYGDDLLALLDEIGVVRCRFVGHSVSGMVGAIAAIEDPALFETLVLLNASPRYLDEPGYHGGFDPAGLANLLGAMSANYQAWVAGFAPLAVAADVPHAVQDFAAGLLAMRPDVMVRTARMIFETDVRHLLDRIAVPTILVHSRGDIAVPGAVAHYLHERIRGSELIWIEATGHLPHLSQPDVVAAAIRGYLA